MQILKTITFLLLFTIIIKAQEYNQGRYVSTTTHKIIIPENGTLDEALKLSSEWAEAVLKKHPQMVDIRYLLQSEVTDTMDLLVLYEYESVESAKGSGKYIQKLMNEYWPDEKLKNEFFAKMRKYINPKNNIRKSYNEIITSRN